MKELTRAREILNEMLDEIPLPLDDVGVIEMGRVSSRIETLNKAEWIITTTLKQDDPQA